VGFINGNFETGSLGWIEIPGNALITKFSGVGAHSGQWLAHFEGVQHTHPEIQQEINLGTTPVYLRYYWQISSVGDGSGVDAFVVLLDTLVVERETLGVSTDTGGQWVVHSINLSAYANQQLTVRFRLEQASDQQTDVYVDDVDLSGTPSPTSCCLRRQHHDLRGYPALRAEEETEETLAVEPNQEQVKKGKREQE
jgi:hypothetical protein